MHTRLLVFVLSCSTLACGPTELPPDSECTRGARESDLSEGAWQGPGVTADGRLTDSPDVVLSTTFLALKLDAGPHFQQLFTDVATDLRTREGLVAYKVATSTRCNTARTLSVWSDEAHMFAFATASAHAKAAGNMGSLSRGNSAVTHWHDSSANATFDAAFVKIGAVDAPF